MNLRALSFGLGLVGAAILLVRQWQKEREEEELRSTTRFFPSGRTGKGLGFMESQIPITKLPPSLREAGPITFRLLSRPSQVTLSINGKDEKRTTPVTLEEVTSAQAVRGGTYFSEHPVFAQDKWPPQYIIPQISEIEDLAVIMDCSPDRTMGCYVSAYTLFSPTGSNKHYVGEYKTAIDLGYSGPLLEFGCARLSQNFEGAGRYTFSGKAPVNKMRGDFQLFVESSEKGAVADKRLIPANPDCDAGGFGL